MIRLIEWLIFGHFHKWKILRETPLLKYSDFMGRGTPQRGITYVLQCEHCGRLKGHDTV